MKKIELEELLIKCCIRFIKVKTKTVLDATSMTLIPIIQEKKVAPDSIHNSELLLGFRMVLEMSEFKRNRINP